MNKILSLLALSFVFSFATSENDFLDKNACSQIIDKDIYTVCYSYKYKGALVSWSTIEGKLAIKKGIEHRPYFYEENSIPAKYRTYYKDYTNYGKLYNRGHLTPDADVDYDIEALNKSYSMVNIVPMSAKLNQKTWVKLEKYSRLVASKLGTLDVVTIIDYSNSKVRFNGITVPSGFYRILFNDSKKFKKCFFYENTLDIDVENDDLHNHEIDCNTIKKVTI